MAIKVKDGELEPAVAYLRKSTKGERKDRHGKVRQRQEKSLQQQREEILKLARGRYHIPAWFEDDGISGWKRGPARPDFMRMKDQAAALGAKAVLCDAIDRFSRACYDDVMDDARALRKAGVRWVVTSAGRTYDLDAGRQSDLGGIVILAADACAAAQYSKNLSRRITLARRNAAEEGIRTGGRAPYGLVNDGEGGLAVGDKVRAGAVRWIYEQLADGLRGLNWLARDLNARGVPPPQGKSWYPCSIALMISQPAYKGDFAFNRKHVGAFYGIDGDGEVVESDKLTGRKVFTEQGVYEALVDADLWEAAQKRLTVLGADPARSRRKYALSGVLVCDHCGCGMAGITTKGRHGKVGPIVYRCNARALGLECRQYSVRESEILPFLLGLLGEEVEDLQRLISLPPDRLAKPDREAEQTRAAKQEEHDRLAEKVERAEANLLELEDPRQVKALSGTVSGWRDELERLEAELSVPLTRGGFSKEQADALVDWFREFHSTMVELPFEVEADVSDEDGPGTVMTCVAEPRRVNEALLAVGCEVRLRFGETGKPRPVVSGRFRLGQQRGKLPSQVLNTTDRRGRPRTRR
jgi:DNA invertase Pin-like site-specific DNA recombinase